MAAIATVAKCLHNVMRACKILKVALGRGSVFFQSRLLCHTLTEQRAGWAQAERAASEQYWA